MPETFKKRQKEAARREKQQKKLERRLARKTEKPKSDITQPDAASADPGDRTRFDELRG
jgi:hypothetical protein